MLYYCTNWFPLIILFFSLIQGCKDTPSPQSITYYHNGTIYSMDDQKGKYTAMVVENGKIRALGGEEIRSEIGDRKVRTVDLKGRYVFPGLIEGHGHFMSLGEVVCGLDIAGLESWDQVLEVTVRYAEEQVDTGWILGKGWHPNHWASHPQNLTEGFPDHTELSRLFPDRPVVLQHSSYHALLANKKAMDIAGITSDTPDPDGGRIVRFEDGSPTGMLEENAMGMVMGAYQEWKDNRPELEKAAEIRKYLDSATQQCLSYGITTFVDAGISAEEFRSFQDYHQNQGMDMRVWAMASGPRLLDGDFDGLVPYRSDDNRLFVQATKAFIDGALGANGAWLMDEYVDQPTWFGQNVTDLYTLESIGQKCIDLNLQYCVHAIGDRANHEVLNIYEKLFDDNDRLGRDMRWRIEHAQIIQPADVGRFAELGVIPSMQAVHCTSDAPMVIPKIGDSLARTGAYPWRSLIDQGSIIANGTDTPVERVNPFENLYAAVTRRSQPDDTAFFPEQAMTREEALKSLTIWNAYAARLDESTGSLVTGKWADFIVLDTDLLNCESSDILRANVLATYVDGRLVWSEKTKWRSENQ